MVNLKDQIQQELRKKREGSKKPAPAKPGAVAAAGDRLNRIRPQLDELPHSTENYTLKLEYAVGPYASDIAIVELYDSNDIWFARWEIAPTVGGSEAEWELTGKPDGSATYHEWFRNADALFEYLTASIAERVIQMGRTDTTT
jgi:hypothetical protein